MNDCAWIYENYFVNWLGNKYECNERNSEIQACTGFLACDHCDTGSVPYQLSHCYDGGS